MSKNTILFCIIALLISVNEYVQYQLKSNNTQNGYVNGMSSFLNVNPLHLNNHLSNLADTSKFIPIDSNGITGKKGLQCFGRRAAMDSRNDFLSLFHLFLVSPKVGFIYN